MINDADAVQSALTDAADYLRQIGEFDIAQELSALRSNSPLTNQSIIALQSAVYILRAEGYHDFDTIFHISALTE